LNGTVISRCGVSNAPKAVSYNPVQSVCGDSSITDLENCDDGNAVAGDGCDASCNVESGWKCQSAPSKCEKLSKFLLLRGQLNASMHSQF